MSCRSMLITQKGVLNVKRSGKSIIAVSLGQVVLGEQAGYFLLILFWL